MEDKEKMYEQLRDAVAFGNSITQTRYFGAGAKVSKHPLAGLKGLLLQKEAKEKALKTNSYQLAEEEINLRELKHSIEKTTNKFEKERLQLQYDRRISDMPKSEKLFKDAELEIASIKRMIDQTIEAIGHVPTREDWERAQPEFWAAELLQTAQIESFANPHCKPNVGTLQALQKLGIPADKVQFIWNNMNTQDALIAHPKLVKAVEDLGYNYENLVQLEWKPLEDTNVYLHYGKNKDKE